MKVVVLLSLIERQALQIGLAGALLFVAKDAHREFDCLD